MSSAARLFLKFIRLYQLLFSSFMGRSCRFHPTCSIYMTQAVGRFGFWRGAFLGARRIMRCHPFNRGGYDPVPETFFSKKPSCCDTHRATPNT